MSFFFFRNTWNKSKLKQKKKSFKNYNQPTMDENNWNFFYENFLLNIHYSHTHTHTIKQILEFCKNNTGKKFNAKKKFENSMCVNKKKQWLIFSFTQTTYVEQKWLARMNHHGQVYYMLNIDIFLHVFDLDYQHHHHHRRRHRLKVYDFYPIIDIL